VARFARFKLQGFALPPKLKKAENKALFPAFILPILIKKRFAKPDGSRTQTGFYRLFCVNTALKCLTIRQYSFTILPCLNKNQADINCKHLSVRSFCDNCAAIEAVWLAPINENAVELAKKSKREAIWVRFPSGMPVSTQISFYYLTMTFTKFPVEYLLPIPSLL